MRKTVQVKRPSRRESCPLRAGNVLIMAAPPEGAPAVTGAYVRHLLGEDSVT